MAVPAIPAERTASARPNPEAFIDQQTLQFLTKNRLARAPYNGWVMVNKHAYSFFDNYVAPEHPSDNFLMVPEFIMSARTFEALEFDPKKAQELYSKLESQARGRAVGAGDVLKYAMKYVKEYPGDAIDKRDDWLGVMAGLGIKDEWRESVMKGNLSQIPRKRSLKDDLLCMMAACFKEMQNINGKVYEKYLDRCTKQDMIPHKFMPYRYSYKGW